MGKNMQIKLKNIGKLKEADIKIDGITVIAGKNNTGKSTVGKSLYCLISSLYNIEKKIEDDKYAYIYREVRNLFRTRTLSTTRKIITKNSDIIKKIAEQILSLDLDKAKKLVTKAYNEIEQSEQDLLYLSIDEIYKALFDIQDVLNIPNNDFYIHRLESIFEAEFKNQVNFINSRRSGSIELTIKEKKINIKIYNDKIIHNQYMELESDIVYIDSPFVLDSIEDNNCIDELEHRCNIIQKLIEKNDDTNMTANIQFQEKLKSVIDKLEEIGVGKLIQDKSFYTKEYKYQTTNIKKPIKLANVSSGLKTFIILKTLILNGHIKEKGCIILDEPEIHLHPEWQIVFAELIVILQKSLNLHILLNTHSPYFLRAIQVYSKKYNINNRCSYYLAENIEDSISHILDKTNSTEDIYRLLYKPFQILDDEMVIYND